MEEYSEEKIISMLRNPKTQREAFSVIVRTYSEPLYWKIRHIVLTHEDADDVLQNSLMKAWTHLGTFQGKAKLSTWLYRIAINEALDLIRKQRNEQQVSTDEHPTVAAQLMADEYFDGDATAAQLQQAIASLPDVQRTVFTLRYYDEMKYSEMSMVLDTTEGALKASYHHAVKKIEEFFHSHD